MSCDILNAMHEDQTDLILDNQRLRERYEEDRKRIFDLLMERDRYKFQAEQKWAMRRELEELLGIDPGAPGDEQFKKGLKKLKELVAENKKLKCKKK
jgi:seryl-tRNA synthetase